MKRALAGIAIALAGLVAGFVAGWGGGRAHERARQEAAESDVARVPIARAPVGGLAEPDPLPLPLLADGPVRSVVLLVGDGLAGVQASAARLRAFGPGGRFVFERFPVAGLSDPRPARGFVPSSDSTATALASGVPTLNGRIGLSPEGAPLTSLATAARAGGMLAGLVTTSAIHDATPAAFYAHVERRRDVPEILDQLAGSGIELAAGGGIEAFLPESAGGQRTDGRDLLAEARARGVEVATDVAALESARALPLWALFPGKRLGLEPSRPDLAELTRRALELLDAEADRRQVGFFLLVEEEGVDTAGHDRDLEQLAGAVVRFDRAVAAAARYAAIDGETLLVVVGDHGTGAPIVVRDSTERVLSVVWATDHHTAELVPVHAYGPPAAAARFAGVLDHAELGRRLAETLGLRLAGP